MTRLKRLRETRRLTLAELAHKSGISISTINRLEKGEVRPMHATAVALEKALGVKRLFTESV